MHCIPPAADVYMMYDIASTLVQHLKGRNVEHLLKRCTVNHTTGNLSQRLTGCKAVFGNVSEDSPANGWLHCRTKVINKNL